jgi:intein/homing endonuclease
MKLLELNKIIELNNNGYSLKEVTEYFERSNYQDIQGFLKTRNIKLFWKRKRKYLISENFFEKIDCEIKAYLLGFFFADGCIYSHNRIGLCIQAEDVYILNLFRDFISPESYIKNTNNIKGAKNRKPQIIWRIHSQKIVNDLYKLGLTQRKTLNPNILFPKLEPSLVHHFIRGYFDGDGCVSRARNTTNRVRFSSTWKKFFEDIQDILYKENISKVSIYEILGKTCTYYSLATHSIRDGDKMYFYLYKDANYFLERKHKKFYIHNTEVTAKTKKLAAP